MPDALTRVQAARAQQQRPRRAGEMLTRRPADEPVPAEPRGTFSDFARGALPIAGATLGAGAGSPAGFSGAAAGAALGAAGGRGLADLAIEGELTEAGPLALEAGTGAAGPLTGRLVQKGVRALAGIPSLRRARRAEALEGHRSALRGEAAELQQVRQSIADYTRTNRIRIRELDDVVARQTARAEEVARNPNIKPFEKAWERRKAKEAAENARKARALMERQVREAQELLQQPENIALDIAIRRRLQALPAGAAAGPAGAALGFLHAGVPGAIGGGAIAFVLARVRAGVADRLASNPNFVMWAQRTAGERPTAMVSTFLTQVLVQSTDERELDAAQAFYDELLEFAGEVLPLEAMGLPLGPPDRDEGLERARERIRRAREGR